MEMLGTAHTTNPLACRGKQRMELKGCSVDVFAAGAAASKN